MDPTDGEWDAPLDRTVDMLMSLFPPRKRRGQPTRQPQSPLHLAA